MGAVRRVCGTVAGGISEGLERVWTQCWLLKDGEMGGHFWQGHYQGQRPGQRRGWLEDLGEAGLDRGPGGVGTEQEL